MLPNIVARSAHPRLSLVILAGLALVALGTGIVASGAILGTETNVLGFRVGFVGLLLVIGGVSGYVAIGVFETHPDA